MKKGYIANKYDEKHYPYTDYSKLLCEYLASKYNITENKTLLEPGCGRCDHLHHFKNLKLINKNLPPRLCKKAEKETVKHLRSKPVEIN